MPRLHQVTRAESTAPIVTTMYDLLFGDRDPVAEPGTATGTSGDWWPTFANVPDILEHAVQGFGLYQSSRRVLDPVLRELGQARAGWAAGSQFVFSQHCKSLRALGVPDEKIDAVSAGSAAACFTEIERLVLAYTDCLVLDRGRVPDALFRAIHEQLGDVATLELTYITALYLQHAVMSRALRTEWDDVDERVVEVAGPEGDGASVGLDIARPEPD
ncbi:MAG TPA: carboxymuconolactone decarboxylase family protein [Acidimicrobiia bacterium]|jgi:alkylhydroperoxidase family enzyme|nr:carboxymuconolactone decarboxylase family protein [Acidimicrobiia bacterium]